LARYVTHRQAIYLFSLSSKRRIAALTLQAGMQYGNEQRNMECLPALWPRKRKSRIPADRQSELAHMTLQIRNDGLEISSAMLLLRHDLDDLSGTVSAIPIAGYGLPAACSRIRPSR